MAALSSLPAGRSWLSRYGMPPGSCRYASGGEAASEDTRTLNGRPESAENGVRIHCPAATWSWRRLMSASRYGTTMVVTRRTSGPSAVSGPQPLTTPTYAPGRARGESRNRSGTLEAASPSETVDGAVIQGTELWKRSASAPLPPTRCSENWGDGSGFPRAQLPQTRHWYRWVS